MSFINLEKKYCFIHIPRCGGTSMGEALGGNTTHFKIGYFKRFFEQGVMTGIRWEDIFKFAFVRNPYDRLLSAYLFNNQNNKYFKEFVFDMFLNVGKVGWDYNPMQYHPVYQPQTLFVYFNGSQEVGFLGRFENIQEDWEKVCEIIKVKAKLPHKNASRRLDYEKYYDHEMKDWVQKLYKEDFINFSYGT